MDIRFSSDKNVEKLYYEQAPVLEVSSVSLQTDDKNWSLRLGLTNFVVKIAGFTENDTLSLESQDILLLNISRYQTQPVFPVNRFFRIPLQQTLAKQKSVKWQVEITLNNFEFRYTEFIEMSLIQQPTTGI
ncbi:MAG: hypothetical protein DI535_00800 [Citrobacter freundii]|nr:MAG: hypothetical protein DI535_00800 [Citrobacter freundii]